MQPNREIKALLQLLDDPDYEVYDTVATKLVHYGKKIIPNLEALWETITDEDVQERIAALIHRVHFPDLQHDFHLWATEPQPGLLRGAILVAQYQYPDLNVGAILAQFDKMRRNIWLELSQYLTPLEQVNVFNSILYSYYKLQGHELAEREPNRFFINTVMESHQGNSFTIGILYLSLCELLDVPIFAIDIPRQFVFAYIDTLHHFLRPDTDGEQQIQFYIDPLNGSVYSQTEIDQYLKKMNAQEKATFFAPLSSRKVIFKMMEELALCYRYRHDDDKAEEVLQLMKIIEEQ